MKNLVQYDENGYSYIVNENAKKYDDHISGSVRAFSYKIDTIESFAKITKSTKILLVISLYLASLMVIR